MPNWSGDVWFILSVVTVFILWVFLACLFITEKDEEKESK